MRKLFMVFVVMAALVLGILGASSIAMAAPDGPVGPPGPFLCPSVGNANAAAHNGQGWHELDGDPGSFTFLPGNNQAGAHANPNARNTENGDTSPGPGHNPDWSPIWPGNTVD